jgi:hypothetical protein
MRPAFESLAAAIYQHAADEVGSDDARELSDWVEGWAKRFGVDESSSSRGQLDEIVRAAPLFEDAQVAVGARVVEWEIGRGSKVAAHEIVALGAKAALLAYRDSGVMRKVWQTTGDTCPICSEMNGRTVSISEPFVKTGDEVDPGDGQTTPLRVERNFAAPPLHQGCDCTVVASL